VDLRAARECKEGILQFKNVAQGTNPQSVENVVRHLIATAEAKVEEAAKEVTDRVSKLTKQHQSEVLCIVKADMRDSIYFKIQYDTCYSTEARHVHLQ